MLADGLRCFRAQEYAPGLAVCLIGAARLLLEAYDDPPRAAYWLGAGAAMNPTIGAGPATANRARAEPVARAARQRLGESAFEIHWTAGQQAPEDAAGLARKLLALADRRCARRRNACGRGDRNVSPRRRRGSGNFGDTGQLR